MRIKSIILLGILIVSGKAHSQEIGIKEKLGEQVDLSLPFTDETGKTGTLKDFLNGQTVLLSMVYYECPSLCTVVLNSLTSTLKKMDWMPGNEFKAVSVSINPNDTPILAKAKKETYLKEYSKPMKPEGWAFLTGTEESIKKLADQLGFYYQYDPVDKQYAHTASLFFLTPEGKIIRYLQGTRYSPFDVKLALIEASQGKLGNVIDKFLALLFNYDPIERKYKFLKGS